MIPRSWQHDKWNLESQAELSSLSQQPCLQVAMLVMWQREPGTLGGAPSSHSQ